MANIKEREDMATLSFNGESYTVDHAVKGADYVHGYDADGVAIVCFDGVSDFSGITYDGTYMSPGDCLEEPCNDVKYCGGSLKTRGGTTLTPTDFNAVPETRKVNGKALSADVSITASDVGAVNPNLLDNWYFLNPVNQRGKTSYIQGEFVLDRWKSSSGSTCVGEITANGLHTTSGKSFLFQAFEDSLKTALDGKTVTVSVLTDSGLYTHTCTVDLVNTGYFGGTGYLTADQVNFFGLYRASNGSMYVQIAFNSSVFIKAVKLELGDCQTLAHQDANGSWVLNEIPDYGEIYAKCKRFYYRYNFAVYSVGGWVYLPVPYSAPRPMRVTPSCSVYPTYTDMVNGTNQGKLTNPVSGAKWGNSVHVANVSMDGITYLGSGSNFSAGNYSGWIILNAEM